jgi:hypothetical protein
MKPNDPVPDFCDATVAATLRRECSLLSPLALPRPLPHKWHPPCELSPHNAAALIPPARTLCPRSPLANHLRACSLALQEREFSSPNSSPQRRPTPIFRLPRPRLSYCDLLLLRGFPTIGALYWLMVSLNWLFAGESREIFEFRILRSRGCESGWVFFCFTWVSTGEPF